KALMFTPPEDKVAVPKIKDIGFFAHQTLVALRNRGLIDPEKIDEYIARDGYRALAKILTEMTPDDIINEMKLSGLRGRGGGGFPTGIKWETCQKASGDIKYIICNADEGDPGAYMDRSIVEADPHSVIEGMLIGARAIGAEEGYIYIRAEYPLAVERIEKAIKAAREYGLLGKNILGFDFNFDLKVFQGAGAFVCGESTTLMKSIEGRPPEPRLTPPRSAVCGLWGKPTALNNVETLANIPAIISKGSAWFAGMGTEKSKGTKVFSLTGNINNAGLVEVPMGITLRKIIYDIGGGIPGGKKFKAVQTGGPSGGCIPTSLLDLPIDYDSLTEAGSMMGSGGMIVMDEDSCMVDIAKYFLEFTSDESCGKCLSCREGSAALIEILERICNGQGQQGDLELLEEISEAIKNASMCELGRSLPNPILSSLHHFKDEYEMHVKEKKCPAKACKALITFTIDPQQCIGCGACLKACPTNVITGAKKEPHIIHQESCIKCGSCKDVCKFDAVKVG
ncbi:MAG: NADH-quinone oxidoreductase subunit NuoF, partial [Desulfobacterales bacterium]|nr:NADH-quinone oxidoreductase subunit NuoF [Desulfobacterales bacterium]